MVVLMVFLLLNYHNRWSIMVGHLIRITLVSDTLTNGHDAGVVPQGVGSMIPNFRRQGLLL
jgi:hypothetical protein